VILCISSGLRYIAKRHLSQITDAWTGVTVDVAASSRVWTDGSRLAPVAKYRMEPSREPGQFPHGTRAGVLAGFSVAGPRAWNRLPTSLRQMESVVTFKRHLKTKLFRDAYSLSE